MISQIKKRKEDQLDSLVFWLVLNVKMTVYAFRFLDIMCSGINMRSVSLSALQLMLISIYYLQLRNLSRPIR